LKLIDEAKADRDVLAVIIFGSHARGEAGPSSDLDVCLVLEPGKYSDLDLSHKKLEYLKLFDLDISVFQQLPLYIRSRVLKEGKVLFCRDEDALYQLAFRTAQQFEDFKHMYHEYLEEVARGEGGSRADPIKNRRA
jgi:predicted nucleotidyltransferase